MKHSRAIYRLDELTLGLDTPQVCFSWRPYAERGAEARAAYDALRRDLEARGPLYPIITWRGHVLIGMRRVENLRDLGYESVHAAEILEDVRTWTGHDVFVRLEDFKRELYGPGVVEAWAT